MSATGHRETRAHRTGVTVGGIEALPGRARRTTTRRTPRLSGTRARRLRGAHDEDGQVPASRWISWMIAIYVASTVMEGSVFSFGQARVSRLVAIGLVIAVLARAIPRPMPIAGNASVGSIFGISVVGAASYLRPQEFDTSVSRLTTFVALAVASAALAAALAMVGPSSIRAVQNGLIVGAAIASGLVIAARATGRYAGTEDFQLTVARSTAGAADPNDLALLLAAALPACLWSTRFEARFLVAPVTIAAILFTGSRGALVALGGGMVAVLLLYLSNRRRRNTNNFGRSLALLAVGTGAAWVFLPQTIIDRIFSIPSELSGGSFTNRTYLWQAAWEQFSEAPILGSGLGTVRRLIYQRVGMDLVAHNTHLSFLVELGIIGWLLFLVALAFAWIGALKVCRLIQWPVITLAILTVGTLSLSWEANKLLWAILITGAALNSWPTSAPEDETQPPRRSYHFDRTLAQ